MKDDREYVVLDHPRWPFRMSHDVRLAVLDEVEITLSAYRAFRPVAVTAYAEKLLGFDVLDIREGFLLARKEAHTWAPNPSEVRKCVAACRRARQPDEAEPAEIDEARGFPPGMLAQLRETLGATDGAALQREGT